MTPELNSGPAVVLRIWPEAGMADACVPADVHIAPQDLAALLREVADSIERGRMGSIDA